MLLIYACFDMSNHIVTSPSCHCPLWTLLKKSNCTIFEYCCQPMLTEELLVRIQSQPHSGSPLNYGAGYQS